VVLGQPVSPQTAQFPLSALIFFFKLIYMISFHHKGPLGSLQQSLHTPWLHSENPLQSFNSTTEETAHGA
jgi:hypothetical protein